MRRLRATDARAMSGLEKICFSLPWSETQCLSALGQKSFAAFGLFQDQELLGYISFYHAAGEAEIVNLAVLPEERRKGYGQRLLRLLLQVCHKMGIQNILLETRASNRPAIALYEKNNFLPRGRRRRYYPDNGEDALLYALSLKRGSPVFPSG